MEERDLIILALRNALVNLGGESKETPVREIRDMREFGNIMNIIEEVGIGVYGKFNTEEISSIFGVDPDSMCHYMSKSMEDPFLDTVTSYTILEIVQSGACPSRMPISLLQNAMDFFVMQEEFSICIEIKDFMSENKRTIVDDMSPQEIEIWKQRNIWQIIA